MKKYPILLFILMVLLLLFNFSIQANQIIVKDYLADRFPLTFALYLSSLEELDESEKEFIDLLEQLPEEEQIKYAKIVYQDGLNPEMISDIKEALQKEYIFDVFYWGMSKQEAKDVLKGKDFSFSKMNHKRVITVKGQNHMAEITFDSIVYDETIGNNTYPIWLQFHNNELVEIISFIHDEASKSPNTYINDHHNIKDYLLERYNKPIKDRIDWRNDHYKNDPEKLGTALKKGHLTYSAQWDSKESTIRLSLGCINDFMNFVLSIRSKEDEENIKQELIKSL
jgi:hypothetical protein